MLYLSPTTSIPDDFKGLFGIMLSPLVLISGWKEYLENGGRWLFDNGAFSGKFNSEKWLRLLLDLKKYQSTCLGCCAPDVVGDAFATIGLFCKYQQIVSDLGYPVAFVTQDGITPEIAPWDYFDVLFIGGTNDHKLGIDAISMIAAARKRSKKVHVGRVNSYKRLTDFWFADSADGTDLIRIKQRKNGESRDELLPAAFKKYAEAINFCRSKKAGLIDRGMQHRLCL